MKIAVIGLGLIGGSICRAIKAYTGHTVLGMDIDEQTCQSALSSGAVDRLITTDELDEADLTAVCLYPMLTIDFIEKYASAFRKDTIVIDVCGIKTKIMEKCEPLLESKGITFIGTHPMAGREFSGFDYSKAELFEGASFIITPGENTPQHALFVVSMLAEQLRFGKIVETTPKDHDRIIAFTSQLAHIVSNAYIKSPSLKFQRGFSAGSFLDLTRVAKLNENMWASLFMLNKDALLYEINTILEHLNDYKSALENDDLERLRNALREGSQLKEESLQS